ncbi:MAG TPA: aldo/keto reductase [Tepidiformaceae bacterium]|nr:aldo/keto reductase [Tepidiformaceae bacterium]
MAAIRTRRLGRTGMVVPELGLGAMDTPHSTEALETVVAALDLGIRFIDTARDYEGSEHLLGRVIRERGAEGVVLSSKTFRRSASGAQYEVDRSLQVVGVPRIDLYQLHDVSTVEEFDEVMAEGGALEGLKTAQYRGLIGHIGVSTHDLGLARRLIESGEFDTIMLEYSAFYPDSEPLIELAAAKDVGVIAMRPVGGSGRTSTLRGMAERGEAGELTVANLLRYVLSNPAVSVAIPGARYASRVVENVETVSGVKAMDAPERRELEAAARGLWSG